MFPVLSRFIFFRLLRWNLIGALPELNKYIIAVVPHTSNFDFVIGVLVRSISKQSINFVGKKELFNPLIGWFFRGMGGVPVDRSKKGNTVNAIVEQFNTRHRFRIAIAPEGTRKKVSQWKTGFYHIAHKAVIPIIPVAFDYLKKQVVIHAPFNTTGDIEKDFELLQDFYRGAVGKKPQFT